MQPDDAQEKRRAADRERYWADPQRREKQIALAVASKKARMQTAEGRAKHVEYQQAYRARLMAATRLSKKNEPIMRACVSVGT